MFEIHEGDAADVLASLPSKSVQCCITSPPYYLLRNYQTTPVNWCDGSVCELGQEETVELYVQHIRDIFDEVYRVLRDDGILFLNLGDSYVGSGKGQNGDGTRSRSNGVKQETSLGTLTGGIGTGRTSLAPKNLYGVPWRVAFALQERGWILRSDIVWAKDNPFPGSQRDRCTSSHEYIFMFVKQGKYFYDDVAIREPAVSTRPSGNGYKRPERQSQDGRGSNDPWQPTEWRTKRDVWTPARGLRLKESQNYGTYSPGLVEPCVLCGTSEHGCCGGCGAPYRRSVDGWSVSHEKSCTASLASPGASNGHSVIPCTVLDPFSGSGSTGVAALSLGRSYVGIELNHHDVEVSMKRLSEVIVPSRSSDDERATVNPRQATLF